MRPKHVPLTNDVLDRLHAPVLEDVCEREDRRRVQRALLELTPDDFDLLTQRFGLGTYPRTYAELAAARHITHQGARLRVNRAITRVRRILGLEPHEDHDSVKRRHGLLRRYQAQSEQPETYARSYELMKRRHRQRFPGWSEEIPVWRELKAQERKLAGLT